MPWLIKGTLAFMHLATPIILNHTRVADSDGMRRDMLLYAMVCGMVLVVLMPSLVCAVRDRSKATEVVVISAMSLALGWTAGIHVPEHSRPLILQVVAAQVLWCLACEGGYRRTTLNYPRVVRVVAIMVGCAHSAAHCIYDKSMRSVDTWMVAALFSGEMVGFSALIWHCGVRAVRHAFEKAMMY